ncbi:recombinase family protein [Methylobacterium sp. 285MFTsu5.1]|uniref:recombinase family protein n=1 Tax=Methylobacterium sp. 285MFTsu5.1 TaxID=1172187 RepID=UPI00036916C1|nr:recombinase family protein [Methylobacterium sp. 285MFTsu5.1]
MALIGYARVSTDDQNLDGQIEALRRAGCEVVRHERVSGASIAGRRELEVVRAFLRAGDTLVVTKVDRLARSVEDLQKIVRELRERGASLKVLDQHIDTSTASGKAFLDMLGVFAEFERNLISERRAEGIARARAQGKYKGRPPTIKPEEVRRLQDEGLNHRQIARRLGIAPSSAHRLMAKAEPAHASSPSSAALTAAQAGQEQDLP